MSADTSKVTIHMVSSLDGFIAKKDGDVSWMGHSSPYEDGVELTDKDINDFLEKIDCYVMGSHTYEHAMQLGWPYGDKPVKVFTNRALNSDRPNVEFLSGNLTEIVNHQIKSGYQNIWMVGGAHLTKEFINQNLADEIVITKVPFLLGEGLLFFDFLGKQQPLHLKDVITYRNGMVELTYEIIKT